MVQPLLFFYFSGVVIIAAALTVSLRNPIYCTIALLAVFLHVAGLFILLHAEFIAMIQIIVYAGAVLVLYLFVLMLLNLKNSERILHKKWSLALFFGGVILVQILLAVFRPEEFGQMVKSFPLTPFSQVSNIEALGVSLFNEYILQFEIVGILLLGAVVGALVLAKQIPSDVP